MKQILIISLTLLSMFSYSQNDSDSENGTVYIGREARKVGGVLLAMHPYTLAAKSASSSPNTFTNYFVADNSTIIGKISRGSYVKYTCSPGEHAFSAFTPTIDAGQRSATSNTNGLRFTLAKAHPLIAVKN